MNQIVAVFEFGAQDDQEDVIASVRGAVASLNRGRGEGERVSIVGERLGDRELAVTFAGPLLHEAALWIAAEASRRWRPAARRGRSKLKAAARVGLALAIAFGLLLCALSTPTVDGEPIGFVILAGLGLYVLAEWLSGLIVNGNA